MMYGLGLVNVNNLATQRFQKQETDSNAIGQPVERIPRKLNMNDTTLNYVENLFKDRNYHCMNLNSYKHQLFEISQNSSSCCQDKNLENFYNYSSRPTRNKICEADIAAPLNITRPDDSYYDLYLRGKNFKILNSETGEILLSADHNSFNVSIKLAETYGGAHLSRRGTHLIVKFDGDCNDEHIHEIKDNLLFIPNDSTSTNIGFSLIIAPKDSTGKIFDEFITRDLLTVIGENVSIHLENLGKNLTNADHLYDECPKSAITTSLPSPPGGPPAQPPGVPPFSPPPPPGGPPSSPRLSPQPPAVPPSSPTPPPGGPPSSPRLSPQPPAVPPSSPTPPPGSPPAPPPEGPLAPPPEGPPSSPPPSKTTPSPPPSKTTPSPPLMLLPKQYPPPHPPEQPPEGHSSATSSEEDPTELPLIALIAIAIPLAYAYRKARSKARSNAISVRPMLPFSSIELATSGSASTPTSNPPQAQEPASVATSGPASTSTPTLAQEQEIKPTSVATSGPASTSAASVLNDNNIIILNGGKRK